MCDSQVEESRRVEVPLRISQLLSSMNYSNMNSQRMPLLELLWLATYSGARVKLSTSAVLSALGGAAKTYSLAAPLKMKLALCLRENRRLAPVEPINRPAMATVQNTRARIKAIQAASLCTQETVLGNLQFNILPEARGVVELGALVIPKKGRPRTKPQISRKVDVNEFEFLLNDKSSSIDSLTEKLLRQKMGEKGSEEDSVMVNKSELMTIVKDFVNQRDSQSWNQLSSVQKEVEDATGYSRHLEELLGEQNLKIREQEEEIAKLKASYAALKTEKEAAVSRQVAADSRLHASQRECVSLRYLNSHLEARCFEAESENEVLRGHLAHLSHVGEVAAAAVEASILEDEREVSMKEDRNDMEPSFSAAEIQQEALTRTIAVALGGMETQREKAVTVAGKLDQQLALAVGEMEERETHINWLQNSLADLQRRKAQTERFVVEELRSEREGQLSEMERAAHAELEAVLEKERTRYSVEALRLEKELKAVEGERQMAISHISSLEDSLEKAGEEALETLMSAEKLQNVIQLAYSSPSRSLRFDFSFELEMPSRLSRNFSGGMVLKKESEESSYPRKAVNNFRSLSF